MVATDVLIDAEALRTTRSPRWRGGHHTHAPLLVQHAFRRGDDTWAFSSSSAPAQGRTRDVGVVDLAHDGADAHRLDDRMLGRTRTVVGAERISGRR